MIPDAYLGRQYNEVRRELVGMNLTVTGVEVFDDATPGTVVNIEPSGRVEPGTAITVSYSKGPEMVSVPSIPAGASETAVQQALENAGLRWAAGAPVAPTGRKERPGTFVSSEPAPGSQVAAGTVVTYHLARTEATSPPPTTRSAAP